MLKKIKGEPVNYENERECPLQIEVVNMWLIFFKYSLITSMYRYF